MKIFTFILILFFPFCISITPQKSEMSTVNGKIIESKVEKKWKYRSVYMGHTDFHVLVKYEYMVEGIKYESDKISFWRESFNSKRKAENAISNYPLGKNVTVYYKLQI